MSSRIRLGETLMAATGIHTALGSELVTKTNAIPETAATQPEKPILGEGDETLLAEEFKNSQHEKAATYSFGKPKAAPPNTGPLRAII